MNEYTKAQIEAGEGLFTRQHTMIVQHEADDRFQTADKDDRVNTADGWHIAGGGHLNAAREAVIQWCDLR